MNIETPKKSPARRGRKSRREAILNIAAQSFYERGYDRTSIRDIAASVGMGSGSIFYHFESKDALLAWVVEEGLKLGHETAERELIGKIDPVSQFRALILGHLKALHDQRHTHKVSVREWDKLPAESRAKLKMVNDRYRDRWATILGGLAATGVLKSDIEATRRMLVSCLNWTIYYRNGDLDDLDLLADRIAATGLNMSIADFRALVDRAAAAA